MRLSVDRVHLLQRPSPLVANTPPVRSPPLPFRFFFMNLSLWLRGPFQQVVNSPSLTASIDIGHNCYWGLPPPATSCLYAVILAAMPPSSPCLCKAWRQMALGPLHQTVQLIQTAATMYFRASTCTSSRKSRTEPPRKSGLCGRETLDRSSIDR